MLAAADEDAEDIMGAEKKLSLKSGWQLTF